MRKLLVAIMILAMLGAFAACGAPESAPSATHPVSPSEPGKPSEGDDVIKVAWIARNLTDDWYRAIYTFGSEEFERIAKATGKKIEVTPFDSQASVETSTQICEDILTMGDWDMVYFEAVDENAMGTYIERFNKELDCPVAGASTTAASGKFIFCGPNNVEQCEQDGIVLLNCLKEKYGEDVNKWVEAGGVIIEMWGPTGLQICQDRHTGFHNAIDATLEANPKLEVVTISSNWDPETAYQSMTDAITRYGNKIIGVFADDDTGATEGVWRAFENAGMAFPIGDERHIPLVTYDGTDNGCKHVVEGHLDLDIEQPAMALATMAARYMWIWHTEGYDALPKAGATLSEKDLREWFGDEVGVADWSPVTVVEGAWGGLWFQPSCPMIGQTADATLKSRWGNAWYQRQNGVYPDYVKD